MAVLKRQNIREPLARAYCWLPAVVRPRSRLIEDSADKTEAGHDATAVHQYLTAAQDEIVNFSVEHSKAKFWLSNIQNRQLDVHFGKLREKLKAVRNDVPNPEDHLDGLR